MSLLGRLMTLFPAFNLAVIGAALITFARAPGWPALALVLAAIYLLPVFAFRVHDAFFPLKAGSSKISDPSYCPWWGAHQIQMLYTAMPSLEGALRLIPGLYSAWLRLWGSKVGKGVYWTPLVEITDRSLMVIGDRVLFGHTAKCVAHVINPTASGEMVLLVKHVTIESDCFIGAASVCGPGSRVPAGTRLPVLSQVKINEVAQSKWSKPRETLEC